MLLLIADDFNENKVEVIALKCRLPLMKTFWRQGRFWPIENNHGPKKLNTTPEIRSEELFFALDFA